MHNNIRSLLSKKGSLSIYLKESNLTVLCICESWLNKCILDNVLYFQGYNVIRNDRKILNSKGIMNPGFRPVQPEMKLIVLLEIKRQPLSKIILSITRVTIKGSGELLGKLSPQTNRIIKLFH